jgi:hypothetical protein
LEVLNTEVTIGDGATIAARTLVLCDVPSGHTAIGVPARILPTFLHRVAVVFRSSTPDRSAPRSKARFPAYPPPQPKPRRVGRGGSGLCHSRFPIDFDAMPIGAESLSRHTQQGLRNQGIAAASVSTARLQGSSLASKPIVGALMHPRQALGEWHRQLRLTVQPKAEFARLKMGSAFAPSRCVA